MKKRTGAAAFMGLIIIVIWWFTTNNEAFSSQPEEGVIDVWVSWRDDPDTLQAFFDRYDQPVRVRTRLKYDPAMKALNDSNPPDLMILSTGEPVPSVYEQGLIDALDAPLASIDTTAFYPAPLAQCMMPDGSYACLPLGGSVDVLYWNKDLFEAAGLDPDQPPQTMEELVTYAERLTLRNESGELTQIGFVPDFSRSHLDLYSEMLGGFWLDGDGANLTVDEQSLIDAMNWQLQFYALYSPEEAQTFLSAFTPYTPQTRSGHPYFAGRRLNCQQCHHIEPANEDKMPGLGFYDSKVAMIVDGEWQMGPNGIDHFQPALNYGVAPFPPPSDHPERANTTIVQGPVAVIPANGRDKEAARDLLVWMMSPDIQADFAASHALLPVSPLAAQDARFRPFEMFIELLDQPNAIYRAASSASTEFNEALGKGEKEILQEGAEPSSLSDALQAEPAP